MNEVDQILTEESHQIREHVMHLERYRSTLFTGYLVIAAAFYSFAGRRSDSQAEPLVIGIASIVIGLIGLLHVRALYRFRYMIGREMEFLKAIADAKAARLRPDANAQRTRVSQIRANSERFTSVGSTLILSTLLVSVASTAFGIYRFAQYSPQLAVASTIFGIAAMVIAVSALSGLSSE